MNDNTTFLEKVSELFWENGAKTLTMDEVAKAFSISKKTLYQHYKNKEALLVEVLMFRLKKLVVMLKAEEQKHLNPIQRMFLRKSEMETISKNNKTLFIRQLIKYYPNIYNHHLAEVNRAVSEILLSNIEKGRAEGLYRPDFEARIYIKYLLELMFAYDRSALFEDEQDIGREAYCQGVVDFYLNAIVTPAGKAIINELKLKNNNI